MARTVTWDIGKTAMLAAFLSVAGPVGARAQAVTVAGGALDSGFTGADVYLGTPKAAKAPATKACSAARSYVDLINGGQFQKLAGLFEEDGVVLDPMRQDIRGRDQIRAFYEGRIGKMRPELIAVAYLANGRDCMVELAARRDVRGAMRYALVSIDHFTLGKAGKIARMVAFARPPRTE